MKKRRNYISTIYIIKYIIKLLRFGGTKKYRTVLFHKEFIQNFICFGKEKNYFYCYKCIKKIYDLKKSTHLDEDSTKLLNKLINRIKKGINDYINKSVNTSVCT